MEFQYYYGNQADQFSFIRIPRILLVDPLFAPLSLQSKMLYGVLLDRMGLSMRNGWYDELNRVYIIYQISEIQEDLGFSKKKAIDYLTELEKFGLVEKKRRGRGLPSILYIKSFLSGTDAARSIEEGTSESDASEPRSVESGTSETGTAEIKSHQNDTSEASAADFRSAETGTSSEKSEAYGGAKTDEMDITSSQGNETRDAGNGTSTPVGFPARSVETGTSKPENLLPRSVETGTSRGSQIALLEVPESTLLEVPKSTPLKSNNNINKTYRNEILSNHILSADADDEMGCDERSTCSLREKIRERIEYDMLSQQYPYDTELLDGIADIMLEIELNRSDTMRIASATYPTGMIQERFRKLSFEHIQYVLDCFNSNTTRIGNIKKYLMTALFNAPSTISGYYTAAVHHDMPYLV